MRLRLAAMLALAAGLALGCQSSAGKKGGSGRPAPAKLMASPSIGPETAPVTIIEVSDFQ